MSIAISAVSRDGIAEARGKLAAVRKRLGPPPYSEQDNVRWRKHTETFRESVELINSKINKFNFIVPFMEKQMVHYSVNANIQKVVDHPEQYILTDSKGQPLHMEASTQKSVRSERMWIPWKEVWCNIKQVLTMR